MAYDHGAFRVRNLEEAIDFYTTKLGFTLTKKWETVEHGEKGAFLEYNGARLELLETIGRDYTPVKPEHPYCPHLCFETNDMAGIIKALEDNGIDILDGPNEIPGEEMWIYFTDPDMNVMEFIYWM